MKIRDAVLQAYFEMPRVFNGIDFVERVRELTGREKLYEDTAFRILRKLRKENIVKYTTVGEKKLSRYLKY